MTGGDHAATTGVADLDAVTRATPKRGPGLEVAVGSLPTDTAAETGSAPQPAATATRVTGYYLYLEVNHSTDFNDAYPANAQPGEPGYSGGPYGSGQPSLIYRAYVDRSDPGRSETVFELIGHGSPDGSDGGIVPDLGGVTTALEIVNEVRLQIDPLGR